MSVKNEESGHLCVLCNNKLETKEALKEHFRKHANKEIDGKGCPVSPNELAVADLTKPKGHSTYVRGSASKFVDGEIACDVCGEKFKCNTAAIQHKFRKHPYSVSKFYCPECGKQFPLKVHRDKHLAVHSDASGFQTVACKICGVEFHNDRAHDYHYHSTHQRLIDIFQPVRTPPPSKKIRMTNTGDVHSVYYCHLCGCEYIIKFNLQKHLERQHVKEERDFEPESMMKCQLCDAVFYSERAYANHNIYHKPDDLYVTSEQQRLQVVTRVDQDFDIRRCILGPEKYIPTYTQRRTKKSYIVSQELKIKKEESSDEMSPASAMDSSSESDSEMPLSNRLQKENEKKKKKVMVKKKLRNETKQKKEDLKPISRINFSKPIKKPKQKINRFKTVDSTANSKHEEPTTRFTRRTRACKQAFK